MDLSHIPKSFWHALSLSIVSLTFGFLYIAYQSTSISIEIANTKIKLIQGFSGVEEAASALKVEAKAVEEEQKKLLAAKTSTALVDTMPEQDCSKLSDLSDEARDACERLKSLQTIQGEIEKVTKAATEASKNLLK